MFDRATRINVYAFCPGTYFLESRKSLRSISLLLFKNLIIGVREANDVENPLS